MPQRVAPRPGSAMHALLGGQTPQMSPVLLHAATLTALCLAIPASGWAGDPGAAVAAHSQDTENEAAVKREIARELLQQAELLSRVDEDSVEMAPDDTVPQALRQGQREVGADPRAAPPAPPERDLPAAIFDVERVTIEKGEWGNRKKLTLFKWVLDADAD